MDRSTQIDGGFIGDSEFSEYRSGLLVDASAVASEVSFKCPVALTQALYERHVQSPDGMDVTYENGRIREVLWTFQEIILADGGQLRRVGRKTYELLFHVLLEDSDCAARLVRVKVVCGPGYEGKLSITVMLPEEDWQLFCCE
jgi:hypothetical protein